MAISKKLKVVNDKVDLVTVNYKSVFSNNRNNTGRPLIDYAGLDNIQFAKLKNNKIKQLIRQIKKIDMLSQLNEFNYFLTLHTSKTDYNKLVDTLRKADKNLVFLSLAAWSVESNLHYHILINSSLQIDDIEKRVSKKTNKYNLQNITSQSRLIGYFRKNIKDVINVLSSVDQQDKDKQIEILKYKNIVSYSKNINKPKIKNVSNLTNAEIVQLEELNNKELDKTIEYKKYGNEIKIDKFLEKDNWKLTKEEEKMLDDIFS